MTSLSVSRKHFACIDFLWMPNGEREGKSVSKAVIDKGTQRERERELPSPSPQIMQNHLVELRHTILAWTDTTPPPESHKNPHRMKFSSSRQLAQFHLALSN